MACYIELGVVPAAAGGQVFSALGSPAIELTSGANGTQITGSADAMVVTSDKSGWLHVSETGATDKAAVGKTRRITANIPRDLGGIGGGMWVSFLADA